MTDELKEEEKESKSDSKSEREIEKVDKEYLSKAKNSRDLIDKKLRTFEDSIEHISGTIKNGESEEVEKEAEKKEVGEIDEALKEAENKLNSITKKIDDKEEYLAAIEETINGLEVRYNRKNE